MRPAVAVLMLVSVVAFVTAAGEARAAGPCDCSVSKTDGVTTAIQGGTVVYTIEVANSASVEGTAFTSMGDEFPAACTTAKYTSVAHGGASGNTASGSGDILETSLNLPPGSGVTYTATCSVSGFAVGSLSNQAFVSCLSDINSGNNGASDTDTLVSNPNAIFVDDFADGKACEWSRLVPAPASCTNGIVDGCEIGNDCGGGQCPDC